MPPRAPRLQARRTPDYGDLRDGAHHCAHCMPGPNAGAASGSAGSVGKCGRRLAQEYRPDRDFAGGPRREAPSAARLAPAERIAYMAPTLTRLIVTTKQDKQSPYRSDDIYLDACWGTAGCSRQPHRPRPEKSRLCDLYLRIDRCQRVVVEHRNAVKWHQPVAIRHQTSLTEYCSRPAEFRCLAPRALRRWRAAGGDHVDCCGAATTPARGEVRIGKLRFRCVRPCPDRRLPSGAWLSVFGEAFRATGGSRSGHDPNVRSKCRGPDQLWSMSAR